MARELEDRAIVHGSDPMLVLLLNNFSKFLEDMRKLTMQHRSFSAEDTSCDKENEFVRPIERDASQKEIDNRNSTERNVVDFSVNGASSDTNSCEDTDITEDTLIPEKENKEEANPLAAMATREEEIRRIEEAAYNLTDSVEMPRASEPAVTLADEESCESFHFVMQH
ncbi:unnamed protein product [Strongylus vulgaris]|uniref:Uncharacterized protein n=1 Tax=Strongylus vulgaris TaxID=40348 RepID=A0A3P7J104_STRVU|nr:unnamed protein product [Strongylus vulgaris]